VANGDRQYSLREEQRAARAASQRVKAAKAGRDEGPFVPWLQTVQQSPGYRRCSHVARSLLTDMVHSGPNGKLSASRKYLQPLGWTSNSSVTKALQELMACGLLYMTRRGSRANVSACYAATWAKIVDSSGLDQELVAGFKRGAYKTPEKAPDAPATSKTTRATEARKLNAKVRAQGYEPAPSNGAVHASPNGYKPAPSYGAASDTACTVPRCAKPVAAPSDGAVQGALLSQPAPSNGAYLDIAIYSGEASAPAMSSLMEVARRTRERNFAEVNQ